MNNEMLVNLVRIGSVSAVDPAKRAARVLFADTGQTSGWLRVLQHTGAAMQVTPDGEHTHEITGGDGTASTQPNHNHPGSFLSIWMPKVNDQVLVFYLPVFNGDGFIIGGV